MPLSPPEVEQGVTKDLSVLRYSTGMEKYVHFRTEHCQKY